MKPSTMLLLLLTLFAGVLVYGYVSTVHASNTSSGLLFNVNTTADIVDGNVGDGVCETVVGNGICSLRAAVQEANAFPGMDTVILPSGIYTLTLSSSGSPDFSPDTVGDLNIYEAITIIGANQDTTIIDGNDQERIFHIDCQPAPDPYLPPGPLPCTGPDALILIQNVTLRNGDYRYGSAILQQFGELRLIDTHLINNSNRIYGGVLYTIDSELYIENSLFANNDTYLAKSSANIIDINNSTVDIINVDIISNTDQTGILLTSGALTLTNSSIINNYIALFHRGGSLAIDNSVIADNLLGINSDTYYTLNNSTIDNQYAHGIASSGGFLITNSLISNNRGANQDGGGLYVYGSDNNTVRNSQFTNNTGRNGGAIAVDRGASLLLEDSLVTDNYTVGGGDGRALSVQGSSATVINTTIHNNHHSIFGNALTVRKRFDGAFFITSTLSLINTTIFDNTNSNQATNIGITGGLVELTNTIIVQDGSGQNCAIDPTDGNLLSHGYNLINDNTCNLTMPTDQINTDPLLGPLADNGGATFTYSLSPQSPAFNQIPLGINGCGTTITADQRGQPRPSFAACDIGAYELGTEQTTFAYTLYAGQ